MITTIRLAHSSRQVVALRVGGRGENRGGPVGEQTIGRKTGYKDVLCNMRNIANIFVITVNGVQPLKLGLKN